MNAPRALPNGLFEVESESDPGLCRIIDPVQGTCTCPHFQYRLAGTGKVCKHVIEARATIAAAGERMTAEKFRAALATASRVPDALLPVLLKKHGDNAVVQTALIYERARRERRGAEDAARKELFR